MEIDRIKQSESPRKTRWYDVKQDVNNFGSS